MAKAGAGKRKMAAVRKKQWSDTQKSLRSTGNSIKQAAKRGAKTGKKACYIATCVYGSYDCPEVWTLRRYRDQVLDTSAFGSLLIRLYYRISPSLVRWFGKANWFKKGWMLFLNHIVEKLKEKGIVDSPYDD